MNFFLSFLYLVAASALVSAAEFICDDDFDCQPYGFCANNQRCSCSSGYVGEQCETPCPLQCQNGGRCHVKNEHGGLAIENEYYCKCKPEHSGGLCQNFGSSQGEAVDCPLDCQNGGTCQVISEHGGVENDFYCACTPGYGGGLCQSLNTAANTDPIMGSSRSSSNANTPVIVGLSLAAVLGILLIVIGLLLCRRRQLKASQVETSKDEEQTEDVAELEAPDDVSLPSVA